MKAPRITDSTGALWSKAIAGALLGFGLGLALSGVMLVLGGGMAHDSPAFDIRNQVAMWSVPLTTLLVWSAAFLFRTAVHAWAVLGLANLLAWSLFHWLS
ncbi:MAG: hypothetical protein AB1437_17195 [Pseudomonadota bacterium]